MVIIYLMLFVSLIMALFFLASFFWAIRPGQYQDDYNSSIRIHFEEDPNENPGKPGEEKLNF